MKTILALLTFALYTNAAQTVTVNGWTACDTAGKAAVISQEAGDIITAQIPAAGTGRLSFVTTPCSSLAGKTITATLRIENSPGCVYQPGYGGGIPAIRLYFTTETGYFKFSDSDGKNTLGYWWSHDGATDCAAADDGVTVTISAVVDPTWTWSASHGEDCRSIPSTFNAKAGAAKQVGFALGGSFYDVGAVMASGTAKIHLLGFTVQ